MDHQQAARWRRVQAQDGSAVVLYPRHARRFDQTQGAIIMYRDTTLSLKSKREAALARTELRQQSPYLDVRDRLPDIGKAVVGYANDGHGVYRLPFPIVLRNHCIHADCTHDWKGGPCAHLICGALIEGKWCNAKS